jgi:hypothetical protein
MPALFSGRGRHETYPSNRSELTAIFQLITTGLLLMGVFFSFGFGLAFERILAASD